VWDSDTTDEFEECCTKAKILTQPQPIFALLESLLWTPEHGYFLLNLHVQRLQKSAIYFGFLVDLEQVNRQLGAIAQTLSNQPHKVRLQVSREGVIQSDATPIIPATTPLQVSLAKEPIHRSEVFLYHKTTHRLIYDRVKQQHPTADDVLLWNERGELTEFCTANLVVELNGQWYTPPVECGLLAGTFRAWLLQQQAVQERIIHLTELPDCSRLFWVNSVRQQREAILAPL